MTNQEAFDGIMAWLTRPNAKRCVKTNPGGSQYCIYYDPKTENRCAIGGHLSLEIAKGLGEASIGIEGLLTNDYEELVDISTLNLDFVPKIKDFYEGVDIELLDLLQNLHDQEQNWGDNGLSDEGYSRARRIAVEHHLSFNF